MKTPGRIPIADARELVQRRDVPVLVIYAIHPDLETFSVTTYGETKKLCRHAADIGQKLAEAILGHDVTPAETEPLHLPEDPAILEPPPRSS